MSVSARTRTVWEYLSVCCDYKGNGFTLEFNRLDVNGKHLKEWTDERGQVAQTLPDFLALVGEDGWELAGYATSMSGNSMTSVQHHLQFKRPKL